MTPIRSLTAGFLIPDANGSATPRTNYTSGTIYAITMDERGCFHITGINTNITVKYDGPAAWVEMPPKAENFPTKAELLQKIDAIEEKTLGTRKGKKV